uniref:Uncharacterized protein n=1 Tax=Chromera velia CCMP2878 TaxID=1169474 RepID=A0A0K6S5X2_9ALVE|eukprot:Cvel_15207.t1-p1 / transcript=Cvel_15207.t1 / gene=Cvel_15207 / organism=Chromera_velia_CCMP2878 / gene_product=hypothetical protein / transcript_product=hypothetical protein / location=Cvel_scaffold1112:31792-35421(+) / protein_length=405 / sequence_SO=supercontig / SO=protein_coding / is_pseudo=false
MRLENALPSYSEHPESITISLSDLSDVPRDQFFDAISEEFATRYLEHLGISNTKQNRNILAHAVPMDKCEFKAQFSTKGGGKTTAESITVVPPNNRPPADELTGRLPIEAEFIDVRPPPVRPYRRSLEGDRQFLLSTEFPSQLQPQERERERERTAGGTSEMPHAASPLRHPPADQPAPMSFAQLGGGGGGAHPQTPSGAVEGLEGAGRGAEEGAGAEVTPEMSEFFYHIREKTKVEAADLQQKMHRAQMLRQHQQALQQKHSMITAAAGGAQEGGETGRTGARSPLCNSPSRLMKTPTSRASPLAGALSRKSIGFGIPRSPSPRNLRLSSPSPSTSPKKKRLLGAAGLGIAPVDLAVRRREMERNSESVSSLLTELKEKFIFPFAAVRKGKVSSFLRQSFEVFF